MKQLKEWFAMLPEPIRTEAMWVKLNRGVTLETDFASIEDAIDRSFDWILNGGYGRWRAIHLNAIAGLYDTAPEPTLPTVAETIKILMDAAKREGYEVVINLNEKAA